MKSLKSVRDMATLDKTRKKMKYGRRKKERPMCDVKNMIFEYDSWRYTLKGNDMDTLMHLTPNFRRKLSMYGCAESVRTAKKKKARHGKCLSMCKDHEVLNRDRNGNPVQLRAKKPLSKYKENML